MPKIWPWAKYQNRHSSKSIRVIKLSFCQKDPPIRALFWHKDSFITHVFFWTMPILIFSPGANFGHHPLFQIECPTTNLILDWNLGDKSKDMLLLLILYLCFYFFVTNRWAMVTCFWFTQIKQTINQCIFWVECLMMIKYGLRSQNLRNVLFWE